MTLSTVLSNKEKTKSIVTQIWAFSTEFEQPETCISDYFAKGFIFYLPDKDGFFFARLINIDLISFVCQFWHR